MDNCIGFSTLQVEKDDGLPTKICSDCKTKISEAFCFKEKVKKSLELLRKIFKVPEIVVVPVVVPAVVPAVVVPKISVPEEEFTEQKIVIVKNEEFEIAEVAQEDEFDLVMQEDEEEQEEIYLDEEFIIENEKSNDARSEIYRCEICNEEFLRSNDIKLHLKEVHSEDIDSIEMSGNEMYLEYLEKNESDPYTIEEVKESKIFCLKCDIQFESMKLLHVHQQLIHPKQPKNKTNRSQAKKHFCELCLTNIVGQDRIDFHIQMHKKTLPILLDTIYYFKCGKCRQVFLKESDLFAHTDCSEESLYESTNEEKFNENYLTDIENCDNKIFTCEKHGDADYKCGICDIIFDEQFNSVMKHFVENHPNAEFEATDDKPLQCSICKLTVKNDKEAMAHMYILHLNYYNCPIDDCGNEYSMFSKLSFHIERLHLTNKHLCKHCNGSFVTAKELSFHLRESCVKRVLTCDICDKKFLTDFSLKLHLRIHNKEKRFSCSFCDKKFVQRGDLTTHERIHTGDRPFKCNICDNRFRTSGHKKDHMTTHSSDKNFECPICFKKFKAERILKGHLKAHENGKPFSCPGKLLTLLSHSQVHFWSSL